MPLLIIVVVRPHCHCFEMVGCIVVMWHGCHIVVSKWRVGCVVVAFFLYPSSLVVVVVFTCRVGVAVVYIIIY